MAERKFSDGEIDINSFIAQSSSTVDLIDRKLISEQERKTQMSLLMNELRKNNSRESFPLYVDAGRGEDSFLIFTVPSIEINPDDKKVEFIPLVTRKNSYRAELLNTQVDYLAFSREGFFLIRFKDYLGEFDSNNLSEIFSDYPGGSGAVSKFHSDIKSNSIPVPIVSLGSIRPFYQKFENEIIEVVEIDGLEAMSRHEKINLDIKNKMMNIASKNEAVAYSAKSFLEENKQKNKRQSRKRFWQRS